jgi:hypothetical protein
MATNGRPNAQIPAEKINIEILCLIIFATGPYSHGQTLKNKFQFDMTALKQGKIQIFKYKKITDPVPEAKQKQIRANL